MHDNWVPKIQNGGLGLRAVVNCNKQTSTFLRLSIKITKVGFSLSPNHNLILKMFHSQDTQIYTSAYIFYQKVFVSFAPFFLFLLGSLKHSILNTKVLLSLLNFLLQKKEKKKKNQCFCFFLVGPLKSFSCSCTTFLDFSILFLPGL